MRESRPAETSILAIVAGSEEVNTAATSLTDAIDATSIMKSTAIELVEESADRRQCETSETPVIVTASGETLMRAAIPAMKASRSASPNSAAV